MGVRGIENKKQKETTETNNQKDERNDKSKNTQIRDQVQKQLEKEETKKNKICKMYKKKGKTQSKITNTQTGNSHPKRRKHRKTNQRMVHTENNFKKGK